MLSRGLSQHNIEAIEAEYKKSNLYRCTREGISEEAVIIVSRGIAGDLPENPRQALTECLTGYIQASHELGGTPQDQAEYLTRKSYHFGLAHGFSQYFFEAIRDVPLEEFMHEAQVLYQAGQNETRQERRIRQCAYFGLSP